MIDWQDFKYTMAVTYKDGSEHEHSSDNLLFLIHLGEDGLLSGLYTSATLYSNTAVTI